jgi:uncharacterized membrane protein
VSAAEFVVAGHFCSKVMNLKIASSYFLAIVLIAGGVGHFVAADFFIRFLPAWMPYKAFCVSSSGIAEIALGLGLLLPKFRTMAAIGVLIMLVLYIPLHIVDLNRYMPMVGSKAVAWIRLPLQLVMILMAYLATQWEKR